MTRAARTVFLGSGTFALPILDVVARHPLLDLRVVVSAPPRRGSRGRLVDPPVVESLAGRSSPVLLRPERLRAPDAIAELRRFEPELLVLADYGQIVPAELLSLPRFGALNLHPSLLPRHRGAAPIPAAILAGDSETGVSLMLMDAGLDSGPLVAQTRLTLTGRETAPELESTLASAAAKLLEDRLGSWLAGDIEVEAQDAEAVTLTRPLRRTDGLLDAHQSARQLERQLLAYQPWPGSYVDTTVGRIIIWAGEPVAVVEGTDVALPGMLLANPLGGLMLVTTDGALDLLEVQPAGGRRMSGAELVRGRPGLVGTRVEGAPTADRRA